MFVQRTNMSGSEVRWKHTTLALRIVNEFRPPRISFGKDDFFSAAWELAAVENNAVAASACHFIGLSPWTVLLLSFASKAARAVEASTRAKQISAGGGGKGERAQCGAVGERRGTTQLGIIQRSTRQDAAYNTLVCVG